MEQQKKYQVDLYIGLLDPDDFMQHFTIKEAVDKITKTIGDEQNTKHVDMKIHYVHGMHI